MKFNKMTSLFAAVIIAAMPLGTAFAAGETNTVPPVYEDFNENDVNGAVTISLPENVSAHVGITFDSPEGKALPYYDSDVTSSAVFNIEGRDKTEDDYRIYNITISLTDEKYGRTAEVTDTFTILDPNDHPMTYTDFRYIFKADESSSDKLVELTNETNFGGVDGGYTYEKEYTLHLGFLLGDTDGDGIITGSDATLALSEYTRISGGNEGTFTASQMMAADIDKDGILNGSDATKILQYYTTLSAGGNPSWD